MRLAGLLRVCATHDVRPVLDRVLGMECALLSGEALVYDSCLAIDP